MATMNKPVPKGSAKIQKAVLLMVVQKAKMIEPHMWATETVGCGRSAMAMRVTHIDKRAQKKSPN